MSDDCCLERLCDECEARLRANLDAVIKKADIHRCPSCRVGVFGVAPAGPADTFICNHCGAIVLPGRKM